MGEGEREGGREREKERGGERERRKVDTYTCRIKGRRNTPL